MSHKALYTSKYIYIIKTQLHYFKRLAVIPFYIRKVHGRFQASVARRQSIIQAWIGNLCYSIDGLWRNGYIILKAWSNSLIKFDLSIKYGSISNISTVQV